MTKVETFMGGGCVLATAVTVEPSNDATLALAQLRTLLDKAMDAGSVARNPTLNADALHVLRVRLSDQGERDIAPIAARIEAFAASVDRRYDALTTPPAPADEVSALGVIVANTSGFTASAQRLYAITVASGAVAAIEDWRSR